MHTHRLYTYVSTDPRALLKLLHVSPALQTKCAVFTLSQCSQTWQRACLYEWHLDKWLWLILLHLQHSSQAEKGLRGHPLQDKAIACCLCPCALYLMPVCHAHAS